MDHTDLTCRDERRRQMVRNQANQDGGLNGIDYIEIIEGSHQRQLCVHFFGGVPDTLLPANVRITGGERVRDIEVLKVAPHRSHDPEHEDCLRVTVDQAGDFSCYKLCLYELNEQGFRTNHFLRGFDPRYACAEFSFKGECPSDFDCQGEIACPPAARELTEINYLAKDYASFRQLLLDRLALLMPDWRERHVPDIGIALVEVLAYVGDYLSYYQDAVATEAYLDTARRRISVRRHARLVDYFVHEGCNARAWVCIETGDDGALDARDFYFITGCAELALIGGNAISQDALDKLNIPSGCYEVFEPLVEDLNTPIQLYAAHSEIHFYTWGDEECCLPRGATRATLLDEWKDAPPPPEEPPTYQTQTAKATYAEPPAPRTRKLHLHVGDILIFEEVFGAKTGDAADADPAHRSAVRLTRVEPREDPLTETPIVEIEWAAEDALPFPLCLSALLPPLDSTAQADDSLSCRLVEHIGVARGNVILVDHGKGIRETIDEVVTWRETLECVCEGSVVELTRVPDKFEPTLKDSPLTFSQSLSFKSPASARLSQDPRKALPQITLYGKPANLSEPFDEEQPQWQWHPQYDLLNREADEQSFVVEIDNEGIAHVRFGDGETGRVPDAGMSFNARYRIGNGAAGNVGAETITYMVTRSLHSGAKIRPRNPLPAQGAVDAEPIAEVKLFAPGAFRKTLERAITTDDYAQLAALNTGTQRAAARLRWTGSWHEMRVVIDPLGTEELRDKLRREIEHSLFRYRRIGHDLNVKHARYVPLDIELDVCIAPHFFRGHVEAALLDVFSNRLLPNGQRGFFHPDNLTFGDGIFLSALVATAQAVEGVLSVSVKKLQRLLASANNEIANGVLPLAPDEIAQLDNNPNFPERGKLSFQMRGGR